MIAPTRGLPIAFPAIGKGGVNGPLAGDEPLPPRELEVLRLVAQGRDNPSIATELHLSASTVKHHLAALLDKLGVENRVQAAVHAVRAGLA